MYILLICWYIIREIPRSNPWPSTVRTSGQMIEWSKGWLSVRCFLINWLANALYTNITTLFLWYVIISFYFCCILLYWSFKVFMPFWKKDRYYIFWICVSLALGHLKRWSKKFSSPSVLFLYLIICKHLAFFQNWISFLLSWNFGRY